MPPPRKREREFDTTKVNGHQMEQELFLQAFEKPTQIYRYLRLRHSMSPIFLNRTLSYLKDRTSRNNKKRSTFKVNSILDSMSHKTNTGGNFLNIVFNGLFDKSEGSREWWKNNDAVTVETKLYKITKNKRKDRTSDFLEVSANTSKVVFNPKADIEKLSAISIPVQSLRPLGEQHTTYKVLFRIKALPNLTANNNKSSAHDISKDIKNEEEQEEEEEEELPPPSKRIKTNPKFLGCELIIFEKNTGCIIAGEYEAALQELSSNGIKRFSPKKKTWESLPDSYIPISLKFDIFNQSPTLKFRLIWSNSAIPVCVDAQEYQLSEIKDIDDIKIEMNGNGCTNSDGMTETATAASITNFSADHHHSSGNQINHNNNFVKGNHNNNNGISSSSLQHTSLDRRIIEDKIQIVYNFLYSNNTRQQTEYTQEVVCPWCGLDCIRLYALLKHLKLCHARFNFTYHPAANGARIDVTINDTYDGSYAGSPYDLAGPSGCSFARTCGPVRRTSMTNLLVCRPRRQKTCLDEFLVLDEDDLQNQRPYITGHNRLYHHTETCLPVHPKELDIDSEGESDPLWLRQKTIQMIDEFSDVNEGEKELMKLWNLHVMKNGYVGDCQLPLACEMFLDDKGHEIIKKNLYRNFILHMCSLFDYGLIVPETLYKTIQKLQGILSKYPEGLRLMSESRENQLDYWLKIGIHKQDDQKLKSPQKQPSLNANGISGDGVSCIGVGSKLTSNTPMKPPAKRTTSPMKKACYSQNCYSNEVSSVSKMSSSSSMAKNNERRSSYPAAKTTTNENGLKKSLSKDENTKGSAAGAASSNKMGVGGEMPNKSATNYSGKMSIKRRLSLVKDPPPSTSPSSSSSSTIQKRSSSSNSNNGNSSSFSNGTQNNSNNISSSSSSRNTNKNKSNSNSIATTSNGHRSTYVPLKDEPSTTIPKRVITRRQSIASTESNISKQNHSSNNQQQSQQQQQQQQQTTAKTMHQQSHLLRNRLSITLTKVDKR